MKSMTAFLLILMGMVVSCEKDCIIRSREFNQTKEKLMGRWNYYSPPIGNYYQGDSGYYDFRKKNLVIQRLYKPSDREDELYWTFREQDGRYIYTLSVDKDQEPFAERIIISIDDSDLHVKGTNMDSTEYYYYR